MKKIIFSLLLAFGMIATVNAQKAVQLPLVAGDSIITSTSLDTVSKVVPVTAGYSALTFQVVGTKVSGTITAKAYLYGSLDGTNYILTDSASAFANSAGAQSVYFYKTAPGFTYYKIQVRNVGGATSSESLALKFWMVARKYL